MFHYQKVNLILIFWSSMVIIFQIWGNLQPLRGQEEGHEEGGLGAVEDGRSDHEGDLGIVYFSGETSPEVHNLQGSLRPRLPEGRAEPGQDQKPSSSCSFKNYRMTAPPLWISGKVLVSNWWAFPPLWRSTSWGKAGKRKPRRWRLKRTRRKSAQCRGR